MSTIFKTEIEVEVDAFCAKCGAALSVKENTKSRLWRNDIEVEPCEACLEAEYGRGVSDGAVEP